MSLFNKMLASVGIGNATVDTKLDSSTLEPGAIVKGITVVKGGNVSQQIDAIYLTVYTTFVREVDDHKITESIPILTHQIIDSFELQSHDNKQIEFSFQMPLNTPITIGKTKVWIQTGVDIKNAVNPNDRDYIEVRPNAFVHTGLTAAQSLGLSLRNADCEEAPKAYRSRTRFVQEFEFIAVSGILRGKIDEIEMTFIPISENEYEVFIQVDRKARGLGSMFSEMIGTDESYLRIQMHKANLSHFTSTLEKEIMRYV